MSAISECYDAGLYDDDVDVDVDVDVDEEPHSHSAIGKEQKIHATHGAELNH